MRNKFFSILQFLGNPLILLEGSTEIVKIETPDQSQRGQSRSFSFPNVWPQRLPHFRKIFIESIFSSDDQLSIQVSEFEQI